MCGVVGIVGHPHANQAIYDALTVIQHRGQDAAGIMTCDGERCTAFAGAGHPQAGAWDGLTRTRPPL